MPALFTNNATSRVASATSTSATTIALTAGDGVKFPNPTPGTDWFPVTVIKPTGALEIMRCTARTNDTLTVTRAQESTAALAFDVGDRVELRLTAAVMQAIIAAITAAQAGADASVKRNGDESLARLTSPLIEVGTSSTTGIIDFHAAGGHPDYDARMYVDNPNSGTVGRGRIVVNAVAGFKVDGPIASDGVVSGAGGRIGIQADLLRMQSTDTTNNGNLHFWLYDYNGGERALMYVDNTGAFHFRAKGGADNLVLLADGRVSIRNVLTNSAGNGQFHPDGNLYGSRWGNDYLSNFLNAYFVQRGNMGPDYANYVGTAAGNIGTYGFMRNGSGVTLNPGDLVAGTSLFYGHDSAASNIAATGTWRCMSWSVNGSRAVFMRVS